MNERINNFLQDLKQLSEGYGLGIYNEYDEPIYLVDEVGNRLTETIDFDNFTAAPYVEPVYEPTPDAEPITLEEAEVLMRYYAEEIKKALQETLPFSKQLYKKEGKR